jgi:hypothetical protein
MNKLLSVIFSGLLSSVAVAALPTAPAEAGYVNSVRTCVNLRVRPFVGAGIINCLNRGTYLEVMTDRVGNPLYAVDGTGRGWYKVYIPAIGRSGWMAAEFVAW